MRYKILSLSFAAMTMLLSHKASAGGDSQGNGGDMRILDEGSAWFLGDQAIRYCLIYDANFGVPRADVEREIETAFRTWQQYIHDKKINEKLRSPTSFQNPFDSYHVATQAILLPHCDGSEELSFYLGNGNQAVVQEEKRHYHQPTAFAHRQSYDKRLGRGKGFIWVAGHQELGNGHPNWHLPYRLNGILLHEIGHVFGNGHVHNTIMDQDIAVDVLNQSLRHDARLFTQIDGRRELFLCETCPTHYEGDKEFSTSYKGPEIIRRLLGREPVGDVLMILESHTETTFYDKFILRVTDDLGQMNFPITINLTALAMHFGDTEVFKKSLLLPGDRWAFVASLRTDAVSYMAQLKLPSGKTWPVIFNRNMGVSAVSLASLPPGPEGFIFISSHPHAD